MIPCPSDDQLRLVVEGAASAETYQEVMRHTDQCTPCWQRLEQLLADSPLRSEAQLPEPSVEKATQPAAQPLTEPHLEKTRSETLESPPFVSSSQRAAPTVPGYEILGELGRGGMGVVYRARQPSLNRLVALKVLGASAQVGDPQLARFHAEAQAVARLHHPNIVQIHEVGEHEGLSYLALEFVVGGSLDRRLRGTPQEGRQAARLVEVLARAMHHAHEQGIIHRDLKPANVLLQDDTLLAPKITDFGLAKNLESPSDLTHTGQVMGTPSYMAPEQALGQGEQMGPATDVYALGAILFELLTGRPPFRAGSLLETLDLVRKVEPPPPGLLQPGIPRDLETICLKCLHKEPQRRYASALALADDLARYLAGEPIQARPAGLVEKGWKWARRRPTAAALVAVSVLALVVLLGGGLWYNVRLRFERDRAEDNFQMALAAVDEFLTEVGEVQLVSEPRMEKKRLALLGKALVFSQRLLQQKSEESGARFQTALAWKRVGEVQRLLGRLDEAQEAYTQAISLLDRLHAGDPKNPEYRRALAGTQDSLGEVLRQGRLTDRAETAYLRAQALLEEVDETTPQGPSCRAELARTRYNLGILYRETGRPAEAEAILRLAIDSLRQLVKDEPGVASQRQHLARAYLNLGPVLRAAGSLAPAREAYEQAITQLRALTKEFPEKPDYRHELGVAFNNLGNAHAAGKQWTLAREAHQEAVELFRQLARDFPHVPVYRQELANSYNSLARVQAANRALADASATWEQAEKVLRELVQEHSGVPTYQGDLGLTLGNLGWVLSAREEWARARPRYEEAITLLLGTLKSLPNSPEYRLALRSQYRRLAETLIQLGEHAPAATSADRLVALDLEPSADAYVGACFLVRCLGLAQHDEKLAPEQRLSLVRNYGDRSLDLLRRACRLGYRCPPQANPEPRRLFEPLLDRPDCGALLDRLEGK
jgi:tetratricopeptide (TPR) repeat protein